MIKRACCVAITIRKGGTLSNIPGYKNTIVKDLIDKVTKIKEKNKFFNCNEYYDFLFRNYATHICLDDSFKLFYLQNKDGYFSKKLMRHVCYIISNASIYSLLKFGKEYIINHLSECNIYKYKCVFQNEYYHFVHNLLLLCCLQLCMPSTLEKLHQKEQQKIRLKNLHKFCDPMNYVTPQGWESERENNAPCNMEFLSKVYKCFCANHIVPFPLMNKFIYQLWCENYLQFNLRTLTLNSLYGGASVQSTTSLQKQQDKNENPLPICQISKMLLYLSKCDLHFYYECIINRYFHVIQTYLFRLADAPVKDLPLTHVNIDSDISNGEEKIIDNLLVSLVNFLSSSYVMGNVEKKISPIILCTYITLLLFKRLYENHFAYFNWSSYNATKKENVKKGDFLLITQRSKSHMLSVSFAKKCFLLIYVINRLVHKMPEGVIQNWNKRRGELNSTTDIFKKNDSLQKYMDVIIPKRSPSLCKNTKHCERRGGLPQNKDKNKQRIVKRLEELFTNRNFNFLSFLNLPFLKVLHFYSLHHQYGNKNKANGNCKKSVLEREIFLFLQQYIRRRFPQWECTSGGTSPMAFFTIDIEIQKRQQRECHSDG
ncbi:conserved Plasmodium protein, unknown function [Plasmodium knowlesi strain H]|uniref:Uncharacterized protein n=3 Tax=Plasmodium knowlesi TaxID=5850 RepID=A0A5K1VIL8_PLAKH|nr:conserved Plasmodium protein, unknown function [Plasmodium knowlesi strain H]OTN68633.1 Uncharacterized protein PKNOH_S01013400 [Plasmodium knowlesi]CAA9986135.1 conserved Plasmodium protein, unknown function [Plasmodium knowlesi strain H]SBO25313.1 conserved Plasmodium protein, unknown function [Plasmodium knowlesi strain H]SBO27631.1 conserved Plasmodium protein, unknown function [Plasmodium knowlesi strain H]VVS75609.1 conserved Plasmodium protein, unknown function [Plasmodium knowlesi s|eukprot:XP_002257547.1 hypothetical protein, conserved in Plasmodium species [Plasmodium knowlesi strain H]